MLRKDKTQRPRDEISYMSSIHSNELRAMKLRMPDFEPPISGNDEATDNLPQNILRPPPKSKQKQPDTTHKQPTKKAVINLHYRI